MRNGDLSVGRRANLCLTCAPRPSCSPQLLAMRRLAFLSRFYTVNAIALVTAFKVVEHLGLGLHAAWSCMLAFSVVGILRVCVFGLVLTHAADVIQMSMRMTMTHA